MLKKEEQVVLFGDDIFDEIKSSNQLTINPPAQSILNVRFTRGPISRRHLLCTMNKKLTNK